ncbi:MAG: hypothetical protein J0G34_11995 [Afipia sp.]|uniref:hypothetical protein n=1 Tax=Xanthobacter autotrophicus TaxID=280 RepID=UPI000AAC3C8D|nr:hypothetical protein [Afipia sp.]
MATIHEAIVEKLVAELSDKKTLSALKIEALHNLLKADAKLRPDYLIQIFTDDDGEVA